MTTILIKAGHLFDGTEDAGLGPGFVAVRGDRIDAIGPQSELDSSGESNFDHVLDLGADSCLLPGLINMHTHMSFSGGANVFHDAISDSDPIKMTRIAENLRAALMTGVTTIRDCGTLPRLALPVRDAIERGEFCGPRVIASGAITTTGGHCWYCATEADDETEVRRAVRAHVKSGVDFVKLFATGGNLTPGTNSVAAQYTTEQLCAATEEARRLNRRTAAHAHGTAGVRTSVAARVTTIEHCSFQSPAGIGWEPQLASEVASHGIVVCPTVFRGATKFIAPGEAESNPEAAAAMARLNERLELTTRLADAGVTLVSGNDAGVTHCGFTDFPDDLVLTANGCGFTPVKVLASATSVAANVLGNRDIGVLRVGAGADLLAVHGNPMTHIEAITRPRLIVAKGKVVAREIGAAGGGIGLVV